MLYTGLQRYLLTDDNDFCEGMFNTFNWFVIYILGD